MSCVFKFQNNDIFVNSIKSYPQVEFNIYQGIAYYNKKVPVSGAFYDNDLSCHPAGGCISIFEENVDRTGSLGPTTDEVSSQLGVKLPVFEAAVANGTSPDEKYGDASNTNINPLIRPFVVKDGTRIGFKTVSISAFNNNDVGDVMSSTYPLTASISREFFLAATARRTKEVTGPASQVPKVLQSLGSITHLYAMVPTLNYYKPLSPHYAASSSLRNILSSGSGVVLEGNARPGETGIPTDVGLISIPSIFYGSSIKKGSVVLRTYISGTLAAELQDKNRNGELIQVSGSAEAQGSDGSGSVAGIILYNEGLIILTGSWSLNSTMASETYDGISSGGPKWIYFGAGLRRGATPGDAPSTTNSPSSSYYLGFKGTTTTPTITMMAHARKNELNHSNNPTFVSTAGSLLIQTGSTGYRENDSLSIKNTTYSDYNDPTGSFKKTTYISQIGIYDGQQNLIGIAKLATPVKKTEERDFTFKLKLDM